MSLVFNMVGDGGAAGGAELPAIYATYPAGSVCTCSNGVKTFTAKDTTGFWLFAGLEVGTWTVTTTDPTGESNPVSQAVELSADNPLVNVELSYVLWLYKNGNEYIDVTGGWQARALAINSNFSGSGNSTVKPTLTKNANNMVMSLSRSGTITTTSGIVEVIKDIDLTNINTIKGVFEKIVASGTFDSSQRFGLLVVVMPRTATYFDTNSVAQFSKQYTQAVTETDISFEVDVSSLSGSYDIAIGMSLYYNSSAAQQATVTLKEVGCYD